MIEKPDVQDERIVSQLQEEYGLLATQLSFLPLGWDVHSAVYRVVTADGTAYFLKLRSGGLDEITVALPHFLHEQGIPEVMAPLETRQGRLWGSLAPYKTIVYPFVEGSDGYETGLTRAQWRAFGVAMRAIHSVQFPEELTTRIPREEFSTHWRDLTLEFLNQAQTQGFEEAIAAKTAAFLRSKREEIEHLVWRSGQLADTLKARRPQFVLCHTDIHPGNLLMPSSEALFIVDWDNPMFAARERDLALIGGSHVWMDERMIEQFYQGYGPIPIDPDGLAYYRYERIVTDIAEFCKQLLFAAGGLEDREQSYQYLTGSFLPGGDVEIAQRLDLGNKW